MKITGNKGEWSEIYALVKLLSEGKLYAADENTNKIEDIFFPILSIVREENPGKHIKLKINNDLCIEVVKNGELIRVLTHDKVEEYAAHIFAEIAAGSKSFEISNIGSIMNALECEKIKAPSSDKADIQIEIHDINTGYESICGFSIKSELGNPPTLLNASKATNFVYKITDLEEADIQRINSIDSREKIKDRINAVLEKGEMFFEYAANETFASNLMLVDSGMEDMMGHIILRHYQTGETSCEAVLNQLEEENPMHYPRKGFYKYKFKKLLCSIALGMVPSKEWNGIDDATGGYVIVTDDGECLAYHIYNRDKFEEYLLKNTKFERASTSRHDYASIYEFEGSNYMNLNLQIRFK